MTLADGPCSLSLPKLPVFYVQLSLQFPAVGNLRAEGSEDIKINLSLLAVCCLWPTVRDKPSISNSDSGIGG